MKRDGEISLEQLYKMLHVSKRKAAWMLQNGIIPCRIRDTATHRYAVRQEDVEEYLAKSSRERRKEIPVGLFNAKPRKRTVSINRQPIDTVTIAECYLTLDDEAREAFKELLDGRLIRSKDAMNVNEAAKAIGYSNSMITKRIRQHDIVAHYIDGKYIIPKTELIEFLSSDNGLGIVKKSTWHMNAIIKFSKKVK